jgi:acetyl-CoA carboxylase carboxyl transferase subunit beta
MALFRQKPKIKIQTTKKDGFSGWVKCTQCGELIHENELKGNLSCCPKCDYHYRLTAKERADLLLDEGSFIEHFGHLSSGDPLGFVDTTPYIERLESAKEAAKSEEAVLTGLGTIETMPVAMAILDFNFMAGSMGSVVGEKITLLIEKAIEDSLPLIIISTSGGARMQESTLSLMQMAKTAAALGKLQEASLPYISVFTNPTTGGVTASFASLGDVILAEPNALICFAGPRVIEQTIGRKLPPGAQKSEFLLKHGMIDAIVTRSEMKSKIATILNLLIGGKHG